MMPELTCGVCVFSSHNTQGLCPPPPLHTVSQDLLLPDHQGLPSGLLGLLDLPQGLFVPLDLLWDLLGILQVLLGLLQGLLQVLPGLLLDLLQVLLGLLLVLLGLLLVFLGLPLVFLGLLLVPLGLPLDLQGHHLACLDLLLDLQLGRCQGLPLDLSTLGLPPPCRALRLLWDTTNPLPGPKATRGLHQARTLRPREPRATLSPRELRATLSPREPRATLSPREPRATLSQGLVRMLSTAWLGISAR